MNDLWGFKDSKELERDIQNMPDTILKEQFNLVGEKTGYILYGKSSFVKVKKNYIGYEIATICDVIVPSLDGYAKTILIMYSNPEKDFPVSLTVNSNIPDDTECFDPKYTCSSEDEFKCAIKEILSSEEVLKIIRTLYSKASMLSKSDSDMY